MRFSELDGAQVGVWGAGREIRSFAAQLAERLPSARIVAAAFDELPDVDVRELLRARDARIVTSAEAVEELGRCDVVVRSPGVSVYRAELRALRAAGTPVTTATALWLAEREGRGVIGVTGTKGKSTTAALAFALARAAGREAHLAGNIGAPVLELLDVEPTSTVVVELSSYQLADLETGPEVAVVTSLFREHGDWHGSEDAYVADKLRILRLPGVRVAVLNARARQLMAAVGAAAVADGPGTAVETIHYGAPDGWDAAPSGLARRGEPAVAAAELPLRGEHNALNLCAALTALEASGVAPPPLPDALRGFRSLPHRLEVVGESGGMVWVDDSISTTPESTLAALASFPDRDIVLIGGGQDRGQDYAELGTALARRGAAVIGVPSTGPRLVAAARRAGVPATRAIEAADMRAAVELARTLAGTSAGEARAAILLSPAAPSYDNYENFEARGARFRALVAAGGP